MIHVQIACHVTDDGLEGVRWVLVEPGDAEELAAPLGWAPDGTAPALAGPPRRLGFWRATVMGSGLVLALGLGGWGLGLPGAADKLPGRPAVQVPGLVSGEAVPTTQGSGAAGNPQPPGPLPQPDRPPVADPPTGPEAPPARQDSPASAAQPERLITAGLR